MPQHLSTQKPKHKQTGHKTHTARLSKAQSGVNNHSFKEEMIYSSREKSYRNVKKNNNNNNLAVPRMLVRRFATGIIFMPLKILLFAVL